MNTIKQKEAARIVHIFAIFHAGIAFSLANTLFGDTAILTGLTFWMVDKIGKIYNCKELNHWKISAQIFAMCAGTYVSAKLLFLVPGIGNLANAAATAVITETIGWTYIFLMEENRDISKVSDRELKKTIERAREVAENNKEKNKRILKNMTPDEKRRLKELSDKVKRGNLTPGQKENIFEEISSIERQVLIRSEESRK